MKKLESSLLNMTLVLTGVAVVMGGILAFVNHLTEGPIQQQKEKALTDWGPFRCALYIENYCKLFCTLYTKFMLNKSGFCVKIFQYGKIYVRSVKRSGDSPRHE